MAWWLVLLLPLFSLLHLLTLLQPYWLRIDHSTYSLRRCYDCTELQSFQCLLQTCSDLDLCEALQGVASASGLMLVAGLCSFVCELVLSRRLVAWLMGRDFGGVIAIFILSGLSFFLQFVAVLGYFRLSEGSFEDSDAVKFLAGPGLSLCILAGQLLFLVLIICIFSRRDYSVNSCLYLSPSTYLWRFTVKTWSTVLLAGLIVSAVLMAGSGLSSNWVSTETWQGDLNSCSACSDVTYTWDCLADFACSAGVEDCTLWRRLRDGGTIVTCT